MATNFNPSDDDLQHGRRAVVSTSRRRVLGGHEDQRDLFVAGAQQGVHRVGELGGRGEGVNLRARLHVVK